MDKERRRFWDFQNRVNRSGAVAPSYLEACEHLELNPEDPHIFGDETPKKKWSLLPHQVQGIDWFIKLLQSMIGGGILADEMGLGKTIFALAVLFFIARTPMSPLDSIDSDPPASPKGKGVEISTKEGDQESSNDHEDSDEDVESGVRAPINQTGRRELRADPAPTSKATHFCRRTRERGVWQRRFRSGLISPP